jgi:hypothetical protein
MNKLKGYKNVLLTALFLLFAMSSCLMPELSPELYVGTLNLNVDELNVTGGSGGGGSGGTGIAGANEGYLVIKNSTPGQTIHFIRIKYPDGSYRIIPTDIAPGEEKKIVLPKGDYEVSISEDGLYYSSTEPVTIETASVLPDGKILDTATHFLPSGWWSTGGYDPNHDPHYNPQGPNGPGGGEGGGYPMGYLTITNNYTSPIDTVQVTYIRNPNGSTLPVINPIPGASDPQTLTLRLDPPLRTGETIEIPLPIGWYRIKVGYQGANPYPIWFGSPPEIEREIKEGESTSVELGDDGTWDGPSGPTTPTGPTGPTIPSTSSGNGYIVVKNIYGNCIINVIQIQQISSTYETGKWDPNTTDPIAITPLFKDDVYYYGPVPYGKYKVRVGFSAPPALPVWYNDWNITVVEVDDTKHPQVPVQGDPITIPGSGPGYYNPGDHTKGYVSVKNSSSSIIRGFTVTDVSSNEFAGALASWGAADTTSNNISNGGRTPEILVAPGKKWINIWLTRKDTPTKLTLVHKECYVYIDALTIPNLVTTMTIDTYPEFTTPTDLSSQTGTIYVANGAKTGKNIGEIVIYNYGRGDAHVITHTLKGHETDPGEANVKRAGGLVDLAPGATSTAYTLPPGMYRLAVRLNGHTTWYGKSGSVWKLVQVRSGVPMVFSFDGTHLDP